MTATMTGPRERLRALRVEGQYSPDALERVADAVIPTRTAGQRLSDEQLEAVCGAVEILLAAGRTDRQIIARVDGHRDRGGNWRDAFWRAELAAAAQRAVTQNSDSPQRPATDVA